MRVEEGTNEEGRKNGGLHELGSRGKWAAWSDFLIQGAELREEARRSPGVWTGCQGGWWGFPSGDWGRREVNGFTFLLSGLWDPVFRTQRVLRR